MDTGAKAWLKAMDYTLILKARSTKVNGKGTNLMVQAPRLGKTVLSIKVCSLQAFDQAKAS